MADKFPSDCFKKECVHFKSFDRGLDDIEYLCEAAKMQCGIYDSEFGNYLCPMQQAEELKKE